MKKFVPYEKLSKKAKRIEDNKRRGSWNGVNPVTKRAKNPNAYDRASFKRDSKKYAAV